MQPSLAHRLEYGAWYREIFRHLTPDRSTKAMSTIACRFASALTGYKRRPGSYGGKPSLVVDNNLDRQFDVAAPDRAWVADITYIRTLEGFAYLAVVIDLYSRRVVVG